MTTVDLIVIGAGPGGYELAAREAALGKKVVLIERDKLGGTCLNCGCIPTKVLCRSAEVAVTVNAASEFGIAASTLSINMSTIMDRKDRIVEELRRGVSSVLSGVEIVEGEARLTPSGSVAVGQRDFSAPKVVIATGSAPARLNIPGAEFALTSEDLLSMSNLPGSLLIIGGGVIGMEFASVYAALGVSVTVLEYCREIIPALDSEVAKRLRMAMKRRGVEIVTGAAVESISRDGVNYPYRVTYSEKGKQRSVSTDLVVSATGRRPVVPAGFTEAGGKLDSRGFIVVDENFETSIPGVFAIGDVNGRCMLAHAATAQGLKLTGRDINLDVVPAAVFTMPECAMVGLTEEQCKERGYNYSVGKSTFRANGKAVALGLTDGLVKVITDNETGLVLGAHICGAEASILIQEIATAMAANLPARYITDAIHPHPTLNEAVQAAFSL